MTNSGELVFSAPARYLPNAAAAAGGAVAVEAGSWVRAPEPVFKGYNDLPPPTPGASTTPCLCTSGGGASLI